MTPLRLLLGLAALAAASPAGAVGLGPLVRSGLTDGPAKGFWLTLVNPYREPRQFRLYALAADGEDAAPDIVIRTPLVLLPAGRSRRVLVAIDHLAPGESRTVRVCAELAQTEGTIHARVCSKLSARRVAARG